ncbi:enhancer of filamentation 1 isoform X2 [Patella vulgata]|uniref:enhancer of filamentation 1 isoform X2 n=1 Tax=Patella vulgata TaxID=6465 RepID=UPI00217F6580|nr:enhancer of filamentation 1 isoform X2 [Patella vulgata]
MFNRKSKMFLAKALYDNIAESPDELAFRRGDVITVVEQDPGGLEGWWLCHLRDKQGIAPGNRLKILSGMIDKDKDLYSSPKGSPRNSWDALKTPPRETMATRGMQDYDVPRSHLQTSAHNRSSGDASFQDCSNQSFYDTPPSNRPVGRSLNNDSAYDIPTPEKGNKDGYNIPSNRSSMLSNASNDSSVTLSSCASNNSFHRSSIPSTGDSARSSLDVSSNDFYDIPRENRTLKQLSTDSGLDLYDSPQKPKPVSQSSFIDDYDVPKGGTLKANKSGNNISRRGSLEHALDDIYDVPKNNAPRVVLSTSTGNLSFSRAVSDPVTPLNVYDVPPQVTRDSVISARSDSSEEGQRLSTCSTDSRLSDIPNYDELLLDLDSALERLVKVQQDVSKSINKLLSYVSSTWRKKESLETKMYEIKLACSNVKKTLSEFVQFAEGALGNSTKLSDKKLVNKLYKQLIPLQNSLHMICAAMSCLEEDKWQVSLLSEPLDANKADSLGQITSISKDLTIDVRKLASFIQGNSSLLFKRAYEVGFNRSDSKCSLDESGIYAKPPIGPKGETASKTYAKPRNLQQRPLPPPPPLDRPLPLTPVEQRMKSRSMNSLNAKDKDLNDYQNQNLAEGIYSNDTLEDNQEYDYVQLETNDAAAHKKQKAEIEKKESSEPPELPRKSSSLDSLEDELYETLKLSPMPPKETSAPTLPEKSSSKSASSISLPKSEPDVETQSHPDKPVVTEVVHGEYKPESEIVTQLEPETPEKSGPPATKPKPTPPVALPKPELPFKDSTFTKDLVGDIEEQKKDLADEVINKIVTGEDLQKHSTDAENVVSKDNAPENMVPPASAEFNNSMVDLSQLDLCNFIVDDLKTPVNTNKDLDFILPEITFETENIVTLDTNDKQVLVYYGEQMGTHTTLLSNAIDAFLNCIENSEPPKVFISNSKFVVLSAHKLVYMGDTLHKNLINSQVRNRIMLCANHLCDVLKQSVMATKTAALQYPSVAAVQEMVDRIMDVSHAAHNMKVVISQSAAL